MRKYFVAFLFLIAGAFLVLNSQSTMLGAVIGQNEISSDFSLFLGLILIVSSLIVLAYKPGLEYIVEMEELSGKLHDSNLDREETILIYDSSAVALAKPTELEGLFEGYSFAVPNGVLNEIPFKETRDYLENERANSSVSKESLAIAKSYLEQTPKHQLYEILSPLIKNRLQGKSQPITLGELKERVQHLMKPLKNIANNLNFEDSKLKETLNYLEAHCKVSEADVQVLGLAIQYASQKRNVAICEKDSDFEEAQNLLTKDGHAFSRYIHCINPY